MKKYLIYIFICLLTVVAFDGFGQKKNNSQLAFQYFRNNEYDKAALLYNDLYQDTYSRTYLKYLIKCYNQLKYYDKAEKLVRKEIKKNRGDVSLKIMLGSIYKASGNEEKAYKQFNKTIQQLDERRQSILSLANAFISNQEYAFAEKTYLKHYNFKDVKTDFSYELANLYYYWRQYGKMIDAYLMVLEKGNRYLKSIQNRLQFAVFNQDDGSISQQLKQKLIQRIQKSKDNDSYSDLLIWLYLQEKDFSKAFIQTKALDKRKKEEGKRLIDLGHIAAKNKDTETALSCFEYVKKIGSDKTYYYEAQVGYISALQSEIISNNNDHTQIQKLVDEYELFLNSSNKISSNAEVLIDYAHLLGFYQNNTAKSLSVLEHLIEEQRLKPSTIAKAKIEYADQLLYTGQIWNATLYYSQVIKANPNNEIGNEAQLKKAKLAFYSGDFLWAKGRLDVLKASTSKLIANDAFYFSNLISDNLEVDSLSKPLEMYAQADLLFFRNKKDSALIVLDSISAHFANHAIADDVMFKKAEILSDFQTDSAMVLYQAFLEKYYHSILADNALMNLANLYWKSNQKEKATELYTQLLVDFSESFFCTEARQKIVKFRDS